MILSFNASILRIIKITISNFQLSLEVQRRESKPFTPNAWLSEIFGRKVSKGG